jgi:hypothetical protein
MYLSMGSLLDSQDRKSVIPGRGGLAASTLSLQILPVLESGSEAARSPGVGRTWESAVPRVRRFSPSWFDSWMILSCCPPYPLNRAILTHLRFQSPQSNLVFYLGLGLSLHSLP